jgi:hypothetical protein
MGKFRITFLITSLLFAASIHSAPAQNHQNNSAYYDGMRKGAHGGDYYNNRDPHYNNNHYHDDHRQAPNQGGIGPGKGALIGAAGGAALGAVFGGSLKSTLIGGAAGAGVGAIAGQAAQNNRNNNYRPY